MRVITDLLTVNGDHYIVSNPKSVLRSDKVIIEIVEHRAGGEGDRWYYDVIYRSGHVIRRFDPASVISEVQS